MGSTVTTGRTAAAFKAPSGAIIYCLYEQTYEKNCTPHTPHWSAIHVGGITGALAKIFNYASFCEGGMLQNRTGWMTPEGYLRSWMSELQSPIRMTRDYSISLYVKNNSIYAPLSHETLPAVAATLAAAGLQDAARGLRDGVPATLSLFEHGELVSRLLENHDISAWSLLPHHTRPATEAERYASLGFARGKTKIEAPHHQPALTVSAHGDMILRDGDGTWRCHGSRYEIMASYIQSLAPVEQAHPGNYRHLMQSYRDHLKAAPTPCPSRLLVQIDRTLATDKWAAKKIEEAATFPGAASDGGIITVPYSREHGYTLAHLPRTATTWIVLDESRLPPKASDVAQAPLL